MSNCHKSLETLLSIFILGAPQAGDRWSLNWFWSTYYTLNNNALVCFTLKHSNLLYISFCLLISLQAVVNSLTFAPCSRTCCNLLLLPTSSLWNHFSVCIIHYSTEKGSVGNKLAIFVHLKWSLPLLTESSQ